MEGGSEPIEYDERPPATRGGETEDNTAEEDEPHETDDPEDVDVTSPARSTPEREDYDYDREPANDAADTEETEEYEGMTSDDYEPEKGK